MALPARRRTRRTSIIRRVGAAVRQAASRVRLPAPGMRRAAVLRRHSAAFPTVAVAVLVAGFAGALPPLAAVAVATALTAGPGTWQLVRLALAIHAARRTYGPCRGAGFLGMAVLAGGLTAIAVALVGPAIRPAVAAVGLLVTVAMDLLGMQLLPGAAPTTATRLRRGLDGLGIGMSLAFTGWVLLPPAAGTPGPAFIAGMAATCGLSIIAVTATRAARYRRAALLCGAGAAAGLLGLAAVTVLIAYDGPGPAIVGAAIPLVAAPVFAVAGARRAGAGPEADQLAEAGRTPSTYPLLAVPVALSVIAAGYRLLTGGDLDRTSIALGLATGALLAVREALTTGDVRRYARRLAVQEAHFRSLVAGASDLIVVLDDNLVVRWQSPAAARLFGLSDADVVGRPFVALLHPANAEPARMILGDALAGRTGSAPDRTPLLTARLRDGFGRWRDTESTITDQRDVPEVGALVLHVRDVGERRELERAVRRLAYTDELTGLPNRRELTRLAASRRAAPGPGALLAIEVHGLPAWSGAGAGAREREIHDVVLVEVARRLRTTVGPDDLPARLGGAEFAVVTSVGPVLAYALGTRLLTDLAEPYEVPGAEVCPRVSIGLADLAEGESVDELLDRADLARRRAAQLGRDRIEWYDSGLEQQLARRMDLERELAGAISRRELDVAYQPVVHLRQRNPVGMEALLRWRHPGLGTVAPAELVPVAEDIGVLGDIDAWVLDAACRQLAAWLRTGNDLWMAVNAAPRQVAGAQFAGRVRDALLTHRIPPERLVIEIAEARLPVDVNVVATGLAGLRALGVRTALDDFGAGQASMAHLRRLPVDILKIDGSLLDEPADRHGSSRPAIEVVASLGRRLGLELVAEGLESRSRLDQALTAGCLVGQGFVLGRPAPAERIEAYLEDHRTPSL